MIRLIVNADDLGCGPQRDRGIFAAFTGGIVSSASLLANGPSFAAAADEARRCALPVGVHLNLADGAAVTGPISGLTDGHGNFPGKSALRTILGRGSFDRAGVYQELRAQIDRVRAAGLEPDHLDTHQHCLLFPSLTDLIVAAAKASGIHALRLPAPPEPAGGAPPGQLGDELTLYRRLAPAARRVLHRAGLWTPDGLCGMELLNCLDRGSLAAQLAVMPAGTWELMTHPGHRDPYDPFGGPEREAELAALTAPAIRQLVAARGICLASFGECACAC
jgi:chitin disaccharide deacetylase